MADAEGSSSTESGTPPDRSGAAAAPNEAGHIHQPVAVGRQFKELGTRLSEHAPDAVLTLTDGGGVALS
jgi:hypothetical protein